MFLWMSVYLKSVVTGNFEMFNFLSVYNYTNAFEKNYMDLCTELFPE